MKHYACRLAAAIALTALLAGATLAGPTGRPSGSSSGSRRSTPTPTPSPRPYTPPTTVRPATPAPDQARPSTPAIPLRDLMPKATPVVDRNRLPQPPREAGTPPGSVQPYPTSEGVRLDYEKGRTKGSVEITPDRVEGVIDTPVKLPFDGTDKPKPKK